MGETVWLPISGCATMAKIVKLFIIATFLSNFL